MPTRERLTAAGLTMTLTALVLTIPAVPAYAVTCTPSNHCYGQVEYFSADAIYGLNQGLDVRCLGPMGAPTSSNFVTEEMWLFTDDSFSSYWVETGMAYGAPQGSTRYWFWADNRPGGGYHEHDLSIPITLGTTYDDYITWAGNDSWQVRRGSSVLGVSTANPGPSHAGNAGEELTANSGAGSAITHFLFKRTSSGGVWTDSWPGASIWTDDPPYGGWISTGYSAEFSSNCGFAAAADPAPSFTPFTTRQASTTLDAVVNRLARNNGVATPRSISYVLTTRQAAATLTSQAVVNSDQPVYLVSFQGAFSGEMAKTPKGAAKPTGTVMTAAIDPATGRIVDWGIESKAPALASLGTVRRMG